MEMLEGQELDSLLARLFHRGNTERYLYSTSDTASRGLVSQLSRLLGLSIWVEEVGGLWYCRLSRCREVVATGSGRTSPCAVARAAANLHPTLFDAARAVPPPRMATVRRGVPRPEVPCEACGKPMLRRASRSSQICQPCAYQLAVYPIRVGWAEPSSRLDAPSSKP